MYAYRLHPRSRRWRRLPVVILLIVGSALNVAAMPSAYASTFVAETDSFNINFIEGWRQ